MIVPNVPSRLLQLIIVCLLAGPVLADEKQQSTTVEAISRSAYAGMQEVLQMGLDRIPCTDAHSDRVPLNAERKAEGRLSKAVVFNQKFSASDILAPKPDPQVKINPNVPFPFVLIPHGDKPGGVAQSMAERYAQEVIRYQRKLCLCRTLSPLSHVISECVELQRWDRL